MSRAVVGQLLVCAAAGAALVTAGATQSDADALPGPTTVASPSATEALDAAAAIDIAQAHVSQVWNSSPSPTGRTVSRTTTRATSAVRTDRLGVTHVHLQQQIDGLDVVGATANVAVTDDGLVAAAPGSLVAADDVAAASAGLQGGNAVVSIGVEAASRGLELLGASSMPTPTVVEPPVGVERRQRISVDGVVGLPVEARRVVWVRGEHPTTAWELLIDLIGGDLWRLVVAEDGTELSRTSLTVHDDWEHAGHDHPHHDDEGDDHPGDGAALAGRVVGTPHATVRATSPALATPTDDTPTYQVFPLPVEAPTFGARQVVVDPADPVASPLGWHDTGTTSFTDTRGNNVDAYLDTDGDNAPDTGSRPDGGAGLDFLAPFSQSASVAANADADVTQLFYAANWAHDFFFAYGFDEAAGNFQVRNFTATGLGNDPVLAESQEGAGLNNARFSAPRDGTPGRMEMFLFNSTSPERSVSFDTAVVLHEYAHGVTNRLTGGPAQDVCLAHDEQPSEGWSDWFALMATIEPGDTGPDPRPIATWPKGQNPDGPGIRERPYSTDLGVDERTHEWITSVTGPHRLGSVFGAMLWDVTWALIDEYGFDADVVEGNGGNNVATQLVMDGLKLQPCFPGFVDARDAIILADELAHGGLHRCLLWETFAKRGLGWSARQGSRFTRTDNVEAFDLPPFCPLGVEKSADGTVDAGDNLTYSLTVRNHDVQPHQDVLVTDALPAGTRFVAGSSTCGGSLQADALVIPVGELAPAESRTCEYDVTVVASGSDRDVVVDDGFEGTAGFIAAGTPGVWSITSTMPHSGASAATAAGPTVGGQRADSWFVTQAPVVVPAGAVLSFWHRYDLEEFYDGAVVELLDQADTSEWMDLGPFMTVGGYDAEISTFDSSFIAGRPAFTGRTDGFVRTEVDLDAFAGHSVTIRFRLATDSAIPSPGWTIDDVRVGRLPAVVNSATVSSATSGPSAPATARTEVLPVECSLPLDPCAIDGFARPGLERAERLSLD